MRQASKRKIKIIQFGIQLLELIIPVLIKMILIIICKSTFENHFGTT